MSTAMKQTTKRGQPSERRACSQSAPAGGSVLIEVERMWVGDRFRAYGSLWTLLEYSDATYAVARKHSPESIALKERGHGYIGDSICSFERRARVEFVAPNEKVSYREPEAAAEQHNRQGKKK